MQFRTELKPQKSGIRITHRQNILSLGSCFAEHIGQLLSDLKFKIQLNPFGVTYNPAAIANGIEILREKRNFTQEDLFEQNGLWSSLDHHSRFSSDDPVNVLKDINHQIEVGHDKLANLDLLILTFGTAHVFYHKDQKRIVNNCHKLPGHQFDRLLMDVDEVVEKMAREIEYLKALSPKLKVILTISPVRHIRDGLVESKHSKATLLVAVHKLAASLDYVQYYPSYEIMLDDLRDYRFYNADLVHPSDEAIEYIWDHFSACFFGSEELTINQKLKKLGAAVKHRPFFPESDQHQTFLKDHLAKAEKMKAEYPYLDLEKEIRYFSS